MSRDLHAELLGPRHEVAEELVGHLMAAIKEQHVNRSLNPRRRLPRITDVHPEPRLVPRRMLITPNDGFDWATPMPGELLEPASVHPMAHVSHAEDQRTQLIVITLV